jgi:transcription antitermination factor NusG
LAAVHHVVTVAGNHYDRVTIPSGPFKGFHGVMAP